MFFSWQLAELVAKYGGNSGIVCRLMLADPALLREDEKKVKDYAAE